MSNVTNGLILEHLKRLYAKVSDLESMRHEMRGGFASLRQRHIATDNDLLCVERRTAVNEEDVAYIKKRLDLLDD